MARKKPMTDRELTECRDRLKFLETAWECRTAYSIDTETGRGEITITPESCPVSLFLGNIDFRQIGLPESRRPVRGNDAPPSG